MSSIDNRIVNMEFNNRDFEDGISASISSLEKLKESLNFDGAIKGLSDLTNFDNGGITGLNSGVERVAVGFSNMQVVGMTALSEITKGVMALGGDLVTKLMGPLAQIDSGGRSRALNLAQARFQMQGLGLDVELAMKNALDSVDGTAYGLDSAAKAAGQLAASGIELGDEMTKSLRGIAGLAAMTGSDYDSVAQIFTKVAGNGRLMGMELNQLSSYGVNAAATLAKHFGTTEQAIREMVSNGEISFDMFAEAMSSAFGDQAKKANDTFVGALSNVKSALSRIGAKFFEPYYENMRQVLNAMRPVINALNAALDPIFAGIKAMMEFSRSKIVEKLEGIDLSGLGGSLVKILVPVLETLRNVLVGLLEIWESMYGAFAKIFPAPSLKVIVTVLEYFSKLSSTFGLSEVNLRRLQESFQGLYAVIHMAGMGLGLLLKIFGKVGSVLMTVLGPVATLMLTVNAAFGRFYTALDEALRTGMKPLDAFVVAFENFKKALSYSIGPQLEVVSKAFEAFSDKVKTTVAPLAPILTAVEKGIRRASEGIAIGAKVLADVFRNLDFNIMPLTAFGAEIEGTLGPLADQNGSVLQRASKAIKAGFDNLKEALASIDMSFAGGAQKVGDVLSVIFGALASSLKAASPIFETAGNVISYLFGVIKKAFEGVNSIDIVNSGFFAALVIVIAKFLKPLREFTTNITGTLDEVCASLKAYQTDLKGDILLKIAGSVLMLASAFWIMAQVPKEKIVTTLYAISILIAELGLAFLYLSKNVGEEKLASLAVSMVILSTAVVILASAVAMLGKLPWDQVAIGTVAISVLLWELVAISAVLSKNEIALVKGSTSLLLFSTSLYVMASAIRKLGEMDIGSLTIGLLAVAALLFTLGVFMKATEKAMVNMPAFAAGLMLMAIALNLLILPLLALGKVPWQILVQGLTVVAAVLTIVAFASEAMSKSAPQMMALGGGLLLLAVALNLLIAPLLILAVIPIEVLIIGLLSLVGLLGVLAIGVSVLAPMEGNMIAVAGGLILLAIAINLLIAPLGILGALPIPVIMAGLLALAGVFLVLGIAGTVLAPLGPGLLIVAGAIGLLGAGTWLAGAGIIMLAAGIGALAVSLVGLAEVFPILLKALGDLINQIVVSLTVIAESIIASLGKVISAVLQALLQIFVDNAPMLVTALTALLTGLYQVIINSAPKFFEAMGVLISGLLLVIREKVPEIVTTGIELILGLLTGIYTHMAKLVAAGVDIILRFIDGITEALPRLTQAGFDLIIDFVNTLADTITDNSEKLTDSFYNLAGSMITGLTNGLLDGVGKAVDVVKGLGGSVLQGFKDVLGIASPSKEMDTLGKYSGIGLANGLSSTSKTVEGGFNAMIGGMLNAIKPVAPKAEEAGTAIGSATADGVTSGINSGNGKANAAGEELADEALRGIRETTANISVSEGKYFADGIIIGLVSKEPDMYEASKFLAQAIQNGIVEEAPQFTAIGETSATTFLDGLTDAEIIARAWASGVKVSSSAWEGAKTTAEAMAAAGTAAGQAYIDGLNKAAEDAKIKADKLTETAASGGFKKQWDQQIKDEKAGLSYGLSELSKLSDAEAKKYYELGGGRAGKAAVEAMKTVGTNAVAGLKQGFDDGTKTATDSMTVLIKGVVKTANTELGIKSPSKVFGEIGMFSALGFIKGLRSMTRTVGVATKELGISSVDGFRSAVSKIADVVTDEIDYAPVIRPVLDLNNLQNGIGGISEMFSKRNNLAVQIANEKNPRGENSENVNRIDGANAGFSFVQNNYSPAALSRLDIYRQTKNQFSAVKGLVNS